MSFTSLVRKHYRALAVSAAVNVGATLFGFDTGVAGAVVALSSFKSDFGLATNATTYTNASSNIVAVLNAGAFFGALVPPFLGLRLSRSRMLFLAGIFFMIGGILQTASVYPNLGMIYAGRVISGFGVGIISNTAPVYVAEVAPKELRGFLMSLFEMFLVSGGILAYWTVYGCSLHLSAKASAQWRVPLSLQVILAAIVSASSLVISESPRWLACVGRWDEARTTLAYLRNVNMDTDAEGAQAIHLELAEIKAQLEEEMQAMSGRTISEFLERGNLRRLAWGMGVSVFTLWCGHNGLLYYAPLVFSAIGYSSQNAALLASGVFTCIKFASTLVFCGAIVHFIQRKTLMITGGLFMSVFMFTLGALLKTYPPTGSVTVGGGQEPSQQAMMACIYLFVVAYSVSWGPLSWIYIGEIFPTRIRDWGMAMCAAMIWAMNYIVSKITPIAVGSIGWKTWLIFGTMNAAAFLFAVFLPETKNMSLEEMDVLFGVANEEERKHDIEKELESKGVAAATDRRD